MPLLIATCALATACESPPPEQGLDGVDAGQVEQASKPLLGPSRYEANCTPAQRRMLDRAASYGRAAAGTPAFAQCLEHNLRARYRQCRNDPGFNLPIERQIAMALAMAKSPNDVLTSCQGGAALASTWENHGFGHGEAERYAWSGSLDSLAANAVPGQAWPHSLAAQVFWHEAAHTHGYGHGANDQTAAANACGYGSDPTWHFQVNTMPYIVGQCMDAVIADSETTCGNLETCGADGIKVLTAYPSTGSCTCVADPASRLHINETYRLVNRQSQKCLDVTGVSLNDFAPLQQWDCNGGTNQQFKFIPAGDGSYDIRPVHSGKNVEIYYSSPTLQAPVVQYRPHGLPNQRWDATHVGNGHFRFNVRHSGQVLEIKDGLLGNGGAAVQYVWHGGENQQWRLEPVVSRARRELAWPLAAGRRGTPSVPTPILADGWNHVDYSEDNTPYEAVAGWLQIRLSKAPRLTWRKWVEVLDAQERVIASISVVDANNGPVSQWVNLAGYDLNKLRVRLKKERGWPAGPQTWDVGGIEPDMFNRVLSFHWVAD